jgi:hypothetical protein
VLLPSNLVSWPRPVLLMSSGTSYPLKPAPLTSGLTSSLPGPVRLMSRNMFDPLRQMPPASNQRISPPPCPGRKMIDRFADLCQAGADEYSEKEKKTRKSSASNRVGARAPFDPFGDCERLLDQVLPPSSPPLAHHASQTSHVSRLASRLTPHAGPRTIYI